MQSINPPECFIPKSHIIKLHNPIIKQTNYMKRNLCFCTLAVILLAVSFVYCLLKPSGFSLHLLKSSITEGAGTVESLPQEVVQLRNFQNMHPDYVPFSLYGRLASGDLFQRSIEFLYPARYSNNAKFFYGLTIDSPPNNCSKITENEFVTLYSCP